MPESREFIVPDSFLESKFAHALENCVRFLPSLGLYFFMAGRTRFAFIPAAALVLGVGVTRFKTHYSGLIQFEEKK